MDPWDPNIMTIGKIFSGDGTVNSVDFHRSGNYLVVGNSNNILYLIDCISGQLRQKIYARSHGLRQVKYTHHEACVICSSDKKSDDIRYLSLLDNRYLRYFHGHGNRVSSISMCPNDDNFLSSSLDNTVRLWDLSSPNSIARLELPYNLDSPYAVYDDTGVIFGVQCRNSGTKSNHLKLYDVRMYDKGPFIDVSPSASQIAFAIDSSMSSYVPAHPQRALSSQWESFEFSADGSNILVRTKSDMILVRFTCFIGNRQLSCEYLIE